MLIFNTLFENIYLDKSKDIVQKIGHTVSDPFITGYKILTKPKIRKQFITNVKTATNTEIDETKRMLDIIKKKVIQGEQISDSEKTFAINQGLDLAKLAALGTGAGTLASHGVGTLLATVASPAEEIGGALLDKPLRVITKKAFGQERGLLPSSVYKMPTLKD